MGQPFDDKLKWNDFVQLKSENYLNHYTKLEILGKGGYGQVFKVVNKYTGLTYAAKRIAKEQIPEYIKKKLFAEMKILGQLDHPGVIKLIEVYEHLERYIMIF